MKNIFIILLSVILLITTGCESNTSICGDTHIVTSVQAARPFINGNYGKKYKVRMYSLDPEWTRHNLTRNKHRLYTDSLYSVGDTIYVK